MGAIHITLAIILTHILAFATGYYLCLKNAEPAEKISEHGIEEERIQPRGEELA